MRTAKIGPDLRLASSWPKKTFLTFSTFPQLLEEAVSRDLEKFKQWYTANTRRSTDGRIGGNRLQYSRTLCPHLGSTWGQKKVALEEWLLWAGRGVI